MKESIMTGCVGLAGKSNEQSSSQVWAPVQLFSSEELDELDLFTREELSRLGELFS